MIKVWDEGVLVEQVVEISRIHCSLDFAYGPLRVSLLWSATTITITLWYENFENRVSEILRKIHAYFR